MADEMHADQPVDGAPVPGPASAEPPREPAASAVAEPAPAEPPREPAAETSSPRSTFRRHLLGAGVVAVGAAVGVVGYVVSLGAHPSSSVAPAAVASPANPGPSVRPSAPPGPDAPGHLGGSHPGYSTTMVAEPERTSGAPVASQDRVVRPGMLPAPLAAEAARARDCGVTNHPVWGRSIAINPGTTCAFARAVREAYLRVTPSPGSETSVVAYSAATRKSVLMRCTQQVSAPQVAWVECVGERGARVALTPP